MTEDIVTNGWLRLEESKDARDYSLVNVIAELVPDEIDNEGKNIKLEKAIFVEGDKNVPIWQRAIRIVPEGEWGNYSSQPNHLLLPFVKKLQGSNSLASSVNQDFHLPLLVNLTKTNCFSKIRNQLGTPTCVSQAAIDIIEYFQNRINQNTSSISKSLSWRFLYTVTRNLMGNPKDDGTTIRDTLKAIAFFGVPSERYWKNNDNLQEEPSAFCYAYAQNYQAKYYFRLDKDDLQNSNKDLILAQIRVAIASGFPAIFGFSPSSEFYAKTINSGEIHLDLLCDPLKSDNGHVVVAVGYDDTKKFGDMKNAGAFLIRNSWGDEWGIPEKKGCAWLPYDAVLKGLATNWWSLLDAEWIDSEAFGLKEQNGRLMRDPVTGRFP